MSNFVGLHVHSEYSLLDGASQLPNLIDQAVELGMEAIALTDHGVMYGAIELIKICRSRGIKPIVGNEMYVLNGDITKQEKKRKYHQIVLAKDTQGYKNLVKLTTISHLQGYQGKGIFARPCINKENLEKYKEGLVVTSGCLAGEVPQAILQGHPEIAREVAAWYKERFGDDYYLEIQDHGYPEDRTVNVEIVRIAHELDIKIVATNDSHFVSCHDVEAHDALLCIQTGKLITELKRLRYSGAEYLKSVDEMKLLFRDHLPDDVIAEAISNTVEVAAKIKSYDIMSDPRAAEYPVPAGHTADTYLEHVTWQGLLERFKTEHRSDIPDSYQERMHYELQIMQQMGFATYFLVVWDYIKYARDRNIPVGPGRGSAAGSLVAYALGITNIDPIHHGLLFERFLNPERKSMPDIDTDFCIDHRDELIKYVTQKYGEDRVAQIVTFNRLTSKAVLKDVGRVLDIPYGEADKMAKMIPVFRGKPAKLKAMISNETPAPEFKERYEKDPKVFHWLDMAMRIEGVNKSSGVHAAGVVISPMPLDEIVPLQRNNDGAVITQYPMEDLESLGLLKMDFLGLRNLTTIQHTVDLINQSHKDLGFDINAIAPDAPTPGNEETYKLLGRGDLEGIFQLESSGMKQIVRDLKPSNIDDISSILALYRPGPLDAGLIPKFINRKHGRELMDYAHPDLEPILKETYSILVFQEQIMKIAQDLAGYTLGEADLLRRCLSGSTEVVDAKTGKLVSLQEIAESPNYWLGREVFSLDLETQKITQQPIIEIHPNGIRDVWEVTTKTNRKIRATEDHLFYTLPGWQTLKSFKVGDRIGLAKILPIAHISDISDAQIKLSAYLIGDGYLSTKKPVGKLAMVAESEVFWDEIVSIDHIGQEEVFDLTIPETHNFIANDFIAHNCMGKKKPAEMEKQREKFLDGAAMNGIKSKVATDLFDQMVLFAEYCFNKSHSVAYGYVTYQTAYLKANYPVEYMAALLSSASGDQAKVQRYIASCNGMGIDILPPDVNSSGVDFTPRDRQIVFGLAAIKNLGSGAIEAILAVRDREGKFKTLADLCSRVDSRALNKKALEALIQTGALDSMQPNRHQLMSDLEITLEWSSRKAKEQASGQASLFDLFAADTSSDNKFDDTPSGPKVEDYPSQEKLRMEKELLGFYISDHPLKVVSKSAKLMAPINLSELADCHENTTLTAIILILDIKDITTKKGDRMAVLQIEDLTGSSEAVVFPKTYEKVRSHLQKDNRLMVWGKLDRRDDRVQLIIEDMQPIESVRMVRVELSQEQAMDIQKLHQLREVLKAHQSGETEGAKVPVIAELPYHSQMVRLGNQFWVTDDSTAVAALTKAGFKAIPDAIANS